MIQGIIGFIQKNFPLCIAIVIMICALALGFTTAWTASQVGATQIQLGEIQKALVLGRARINASVTEAENARKEAEQVHIEAQKIRKQLERDVERNKLTIEGSSKSIEEIYDWIKFMYEEQRETAEKVEQVTEKVKQVNGKIDQEVKP